jgi:hypothetical protein
MAFGKWLRRGPRRRATDRDAVFYFGDPIRATEARNG